MCNGFPRMNFHDACFFKSREPKSATRRVVLPYVRGCSERICRILKRFNIFSCYKPFNKLCNIFNLPKDPIPTNFLSGVVYEIPCKDCECVYVGQTKNSLKTRIAQHQAACRLLQPQKSALAEHSIDRSHRINWAGARILSKEVRWRHRLFLEAAHTHLRPDTAINRCEQLNKIYLSVIAS